MQKCFFGILEKQEQTPLQIRVRGCYCVTRPVTPFIRRRILNCIHYLRGELAPSRMFGSGLADTHVGLWYSTDRRFKISRMKRVYCYFGEKDCEPTN